MEEKHKFVEGKAETKEIEPFKAEIAESLESETEQVLRILLGEEK